jgi:HSP20 family protein
MTDLHNRLSTLLGQTPFPRTDNREEAMATAQWAPLVDIIEDEREYLIKAELPEVKKEDVSVKVENGVLTIAGERRSEKEEKGQRFHRVERSYGRFERSFTVPEDAAGEHVTAEYKDGVLKVRVPKDEKAKPKAITVKVS